MADATTTAPAVTTTEAPAATPGEAADSSTVTTTKPAEVTVPPAGETTAPAGDNQGTSTSDPASGDSAEAADGSAAKEQNRLGFQLRQVRGRDPVVAKLRTTYQDQYVNEAGLTPEQAQIRKLEADAYIKDVEQSRAQLMADNDTAAREISLFNPNSKDFNKDLLDRSLNRYGRDNLDLDPNTGDILGYKTPLLEYLREEAETFLAGSNTSKKKQETAAATMDAASETAGGASPTQATSKVDPRDEAFMAGFNSVK